MVQWHSPYDLTALPQNTKSMKQKLAEQKLEQNMTADMKCGMKCGAGVKVGCKVAYICAAPVGTLKQLKLQVGKFINTLY